MNITYRDKIEKLLLNEFQGIIHPLSEMDLKIINNYKNDSFGFSYLGIMLYANGCNEKGKSTNFPQGLIYNDGNNIFGIGFFKKSINHDNIHIHIIAPRGNSWIKSLDNFIAKCSKIGILNNSSVFIRHLSERQYEDILLKKSYENIFTNPWDKLAHSEDETFNHRFIDIDNIISYDDFGNIIVNPLKSEESRNFRHKVRLAYSRFNNFLSRNNASYIIEEYNPVIHNSLAKEIVVKHFSTLKNPVGSTPEDYFNLINLYPKESDKNFVGYIGYLLKDCIKIPVSLFLGETIGVDIIALYATFSLRDTSNLPDNYDIVGYSAVSQYVYIKIFDLIKKKGFSYVDLGGSEVEDLNNFKRQLSAIEKKTYWVVRSLS